MYKVQVLADNSGEWAGNAVTFNDIAMAVTYAKDLMGKWTLVTDWQVVQVDSGRVVSTMNAEATCREEREQRAT